MVSLCEALKIIQGHIPIHFDTDLFLLSRAVVGPYQVHGELEKENIRTLGHNRQRRFFSGQISILLRVRITRLALMKRTLTCLNRKPQKKFAEISRSENFFSLFNLSLCPFALIEKALR